VSKKVWKVVETEAKEAMIAEAEKEEKK